MKLFGKLSFDSCESSIHNYECGSPELIAIYEIMRQLPGVYGGRFSGAGFKGACIALVDPAYKKEIQKVGKKNMFYIFLTVAIVGMASSFAAEKPASRHRAAQSQSADTSGSR